MKTALFSIAAAMALTAGAAAQQTQTPSAPAPAPATDVKPAAADTTSVAGKWNMTVDTSQGSMDNTLEIKLDGKKVTGTITSDMGTSPIEGEFADGKLMFAISFDSGNGPIEVDFAGAFKDDGTLAGTMTAGQMGDMTWRAARIKT